MLVTQHSFDWELTNRKLCIFIPNFGRGEYIRRYAYQFSTVVPTTDYSIVVGNDGVHDDFSDLKNKNIHYFTLKRQNPVPRNGCFIRNLFIKNCRSKLLLQKDPETLIEKRRFHGQDFIDRVCQYSLLNFNFVWRPAWTVEFNKAESLDRYDERRIPPGNIEPIKSYARVHWGFAAPTELLRSVRGYDEGFLKYGPEDRDLYMRLTKLDAVPVLADDNIYVGHGYHAIDPEVYRQVAEGEEYFAHKWSKGLPTNVGGWGRG